MKILRLPFRPFLVGVLVACGTIASPRTGPAAPVQLPGYEIVRLGRGHLNRLTMVATIEGKKGLFIVDTGASFTALGADKYSFLLPGPNRSLPAGVPKTTKFNGTSAPVGYARDFHVGNANLGSLAVGIMPNRFLYDGEMLYQKDKGHDYDGVVGEDILRHCSAMLDAGNLVLYLNVDPARKADPGRSLVARGWTRVPMTATDGDYTVECRLGDAKFRVYVDTGAPFTTFDKGAVDSAHIGTIDIPMRGGVVGTRKQDAAMLIVDQLVIGDYTATNLHLVSQPGLGAAMHSNYNERLPLAGLLGGDILAKNNAVIDIGNEALYLKRSSAAPKKP